MEAFPCFRMLDFFLHRAPCEKVLADSCRKDVSMVYMHGPHSCGKTSMALQYCFSHVEANGSEAIMILHRKESTCPDADTSSRSVPSHSVARLVSCAVCGQPKTNQCDTSTWKKVHLKYLSTVDELREFICSIHMLKRPIGFIALDCFSAFFKYSEDDHRSHPDDEMLMLSLLSSMEAYLTLNLKKHDQTSFIRNHCGQVLINDLSTALTDSKLVRYSRWVDLILKIEPAINSEGEDYTIRYDSQDVDEAKANVKDPHYLLRYSFIKDAMQVKSADRINFVDPML